jgi:3'-phosphoadenosine 5'-phosphosulfate (PAPS) 3'-phosphatase
MLKEMSEIVFEVGQLLLAWREQGLAEGVWETPSKVKSVVDLQAHEVLVSMLNKLNPRLPVISEEDTASWANHRPPRYWLIDPIDGTASYIKGYNGFVTQIALMLDNIPIRSAICAPAYSRVYTAEIRCGAQLNGRGISANNSVAHTLIDNTPEPSGSASDLYCSLGLTRYIECGGISLKICAVADGTADVFFKEVIIHNWDIAAPQLVLEEAGGVLTDGRGLPITYDGEYWITGLAATNTIETHDKWQTWHKHYYGGTK